MTCGKLHQSKLQWLLQKARHLVGKFYRCSLERFPRELSKTWRKSIYMQEQKALCRVGTHRRREAAL